MKQGCSRRLSRSGSRAGQELGERERVAHGPQRLVCSRVIRSRDVAALSGAVLAAAADPTAIRLNDGVFKLVPSGEAMVMMREGDQTIVPVEFLNAQPSACSPVNKKRAGDAG